MGPRRFEVDLAKAVGIVAVVLIHSMRPYFDAEVSGVEKWLGSATKFAVPAFLVASGVLHGTVKRVPSSVTHARLRRLLVPYLLASVAAQLFWVAFDGRTLVASEVLQDLLLASSFAPFYYVLQAVLFVLAAPVLAQLSASALTAVTFVAIVGQLASWVPVSLPLFWPIRNPLHWFGFFLAGWWLRRSEAIVSPWLARHRAATCLLLGAGAAVTLTIQGLTANDWLSGAAAWLYVAFALSLIVAFAVLRKTAQRSVRFLSDSTYTIYLFHLFFVYPMQRLVSPAPGVFDALSIGAALAAGLVGPLVLAVLGRALLGDRSRVLFGS